MSFIEHNGVTYMIVENVCENTILTTIERGPKLRRAQFDRELALRNRGESLGPPRIRMDHLTSSLANPVPGLLQLYRNRVII